MRGLTQRVLRQIHVPDKMYCFFFYMSLSPAKTSLVPGGSWSEVVKNTTSE